MSRQRRFQGKTRRYLLKAAFAYLIFVIIAELEINWRIYNPAPFIDLAKQYGNSGVTPYDVVIVLAFVGWLAGLVLFSLGKARDFYRCRCALVVFLVAAIIWSNRLSASVFLDIVAKHQWFRVFFPIVVPDPWDALMLPLSVIKWLPLQIMLENIAHLIRQHKEDRHKSHSRVS